MSSSRYRVNGKYRGAWLTNMFMREELRDLENDLAPVGENGITLEEQTTQLLLKKGYTPEQVKEFLATPEWNGP